MDTQGENEPRLVARRVPIRQQFWQYLLGTVGILIIFWVEFEFWRSDSWLYQVGWGWLVRSMNAITGIFLLFCSWKDFRGREGKWWLLSGVAGLVFGVAFLAGAVIDRELILR